MGGKVDASDFAPRCVSGDMNGRLDGEAAIITDSAGLHRDAHRSRIWSKFPDLEAEKLRANALHPPGRIGRPEEAGWTAVFLASDEAPFINAATIVIDGGRSVLYHE